MFWVSQAYLHVTKDASRGRLRHRDLSRAAINNLTKCGASFDQENQTVVSPEDLQDMCLMETLMETSAAKPGDHTRTFTNLIQVLWLEDLGYGAR
jgi:hypothetical protein